MAITSARERIIEHTPKAPYDDETWILRPQIHEVTQEIISRSKVLKENEITRQMGLEYDSDRGGEESIKYLIINWKTVGWEYEDGRIEDPLPCTQENKLMVIAKRPGDFWMDIQKACMDGARYTVKKVVEERESFLGTSKPSTTTKTPSVVSAPISTTPEI